MFSLNFNVIFLFEIYKYGVDSNPLDYLSENFNVTLNNVVGN
jgi:hypothetical protein